MTFFGKSTALYDEWEDEGVSPFFPVIETNRDHHVTTAKHGDLLMFGSCDYLGLSQHPTLKQAAIDAIREFGTNTYGAQLLCGRTRLHDGIERTLTTLSGKESAILFPSGMAANQAVISTMAGDEDVILCDRTAHISIYMGSWLSGAELRTFPHNNVKKLETLLRKEKDKRRRVILVDGLYSADGDFAPLKEITELAQEHNAQVVVDEAHSFGAIGPNGLGVADHFGVLDKIDALVGTMSKALGSVGGFVLTNQETERQLRYLAPSYTSSRGSAPGVAAASLASLELITEQGAQLRKQLDDNVKHIIDGLTGAGLNLMRTTSHIVPVQIGDEHKTVAVSNWLMDHGIFVGTFVHPHVPAGEGRLRIGVTSTHTQNECALLVERLTEAKNKFSL
ncbi:2-amino-3-ketobutyrate CoA ligase [Lentzea aerocolonigenes]|uniref:8-amino-7-oxononanoate synthase n=1 Tax=Lentzea aerocolonigenes TaxID=68170 RepID=A0A0F0H826_LENAE|nr:pyridoxal phosphate-dependent aminotransferase family protein [Lentzea aerocolonigenes]KJK51655.1 2-amino-3-ketobutyrate CoA ligase [Lentzea aerocolonigenes]